MTENDLLDAAWPLTYHWTLDELVESVSKQGFRTRYETTRKLLQKLVDSGWVRKVWLPSRTNEPTLYHLATQTTDDDGLRLLCRLLHGGRRRALANHLLSQGNALGEPLLESPMNWRLFLELLPEDIEHELCCRIAFLALKVYRRYGNLVDGWQAKALDAGITTRRDWVKGEATDRELKVAAQKSASAHIQTPCPVFPGRIRLAAYVASCAPRPNGLWQVVGDAPQVGISSNKILKELAGLLRTHSNLRPSQLGELRRDRDYPKYEPPIVPRGPVRGAYGLFA